MLRDLLPFFATQPRLLHTFSITCGVGNNVIGYWYSNTGRISRGDYATPAGRSVTVRQLMRSAGEVYGADQVRFALAGAGLSASAVEAFPRQIQMSLGSGEIVIARQRPVEIFAVGQGVAMDYLLHGGSLNTVFQGGQTVTVEIYY